VPVLASSELLAAILIGACRFSEEEHPLDLMVALSDVEIDSYELQRQLAVYIDCKDEDRAYHARRFVARYGAWSAKQINLASEVEERMARGDNPGAELRELRELHPPSGT
jgi:hypothetical protein